MYKITSVVSDQILYLHPNQLQGLDMVLPKEVGEDNYEELTFHLVEMTRDEIDDLPDFDGF